MRMAKPELGNRMVRDRICRSLWCCLMRGRTTRSAPALLSGWFCDLPSVCHSLLGAILRSYQTKASIGSSLAITIVWIFRGGCLLKSTLKRLVCSTALSFESRPLSGFLWLARLLPKVSIWLLTPLREQRHHRGNILYENLSEQPHPLDLHELKCLCSCHLSHWLTSTFHQ